MASRTGTLAVLCALVALGGALAQTCDPKCSSNGVCTTTEGDNMAYCKCKAGYMGQTCTAMYRDCRGVVCYNAGKCTPDPTKPDHDLCACAPGWTGATCKVPSVQCGNSSLTCMNGGDCVLDETIQEWFCKCPANLRGRQCQLGVQECKDGMFCMNNGACSDDGLKCVCPAGFFGIHCQNDERDAFADLIPRKNLPAWASALIALASLVAVAAIGLLVFLIVREKKGRPMFAKNWQDNPSGLSGTL